jgi:hypothetical protein
MIVARGRPPNRNLTLVVGATVVSVGRPQLAFGCGSEPRTSGTPGVTIVCATRSWSILRHRRINVEDHPAYTTSALQDHAPDAESLHDHSSGKR